MANTMHGINPKVASHEAVGFTAESYHKAAVLETLENVRDANDWRPASASEPSRAKSSSQETIYWETESDKDYMSQEEIIWDNESSEEEIIWDNESSENAKELPQEEASFNVAGFDNAAYLPQEEEQKDPDFEFDSSGNFWGSIKHIKDNEAISQVLSHVNPDGDIRAEDCKVSRAHGTFNMAFIITLPNGAKHVLRVPRYGIRESWNDDEEASFLSTVKTVEFLQARTDLPIPRILAYDHTHENGIRHPYSIISYLSSRCMYHAWNDEKDTNLEATRQKLLRSVAETVSKLSNFSFNAHGWLEFEGEDRQNPTIGDMRKVTMDFYGQDVGVVHQTEVQPAYTSYKKHLERKYKRAVKKGTQTISETPDDIKRGELRILGIVMDCFPNDPANLDENGGEKFSIAPPDFDWQNVLVDKDNNVTGLIDWDGTQTEHGLRGWASPLRFLMRDWHHISDWEDTAKDYINMSSQDLVRYRRDYANYIAEIVDNKGDSCFTMKSAVWQAIDSALSSSKERTKVVQRILGAAMPPSEDNFEQLLSYAGRHCLTLEEEADIKTCLQACLACSPGADYEHDV